MVSQSPDRNSFLAALPAAVYGLFRPYLTTMKLTTGERLQGLGSTVEQVVFPHDGLIALTMPLRNGAGGGAVLLGRKGILGVIEAAADAPAMCDAEVLIAGGAAQMSASSFRLILDQSPAIRRLAARYTVALMVQAHQTALCNAAHPLEARTARLLLEVQDRWGEPDVPLTQTTLSRMLAVQRTTLNQAVGDLEAAGSIECHRGSIAIVRRDLLERHACDCYRSLKSYISTLFAVPVAAVPASQIEPSPPKSA